MLRTIEAVIDEQGSVLLQEAIALSAPRRALVIILEEEPYPNTFPPYSLRGTPLQYAEPLEPVAEQEWEVLA